MVRRIKLDSKYLKPGDQILRIKGITSPTVDNSYMDEWLKVISTNSYFVEVEYYGMTKILHFNKWNDGNWLKKY